MLMYQLIETTLKWFGVLGVTSLLTWLFQRWYTKRYPTQQEKTAVQQSEIQLFKTYEDAKAVHLQMTTVLRKMVDEETEKLRKMFSDREVEHYLEKERHIKELAESEKEKLEAKRIAKECQERLKSAELRIEELEKELRELKQQWNK